MGSTVRSNDHAFAGGAVGFAGSGPTSGASLGGVDPDLQATHATNVQETATQRLTEDHMAGTVAEAGRSRKPHLRRLERIPGRGAGKAGHFLGKPVGKIGVCGNGDGACADPRASEGPGEEPVGR